MEKRFIMPAIVSIIIMIVSIFLSFLPIILELIGIPQTEILQTDIPILPGGFISDSIVSIVIPFVFMFLMLFLGPFIALFFVRMHKSIKLNKYDYFIMTTEKKLSGSGILLRSLFPGLLSINIALYISQSGVSSLIYSDPENIGLIIEYAGILIGIPIACLLILPLWILVSSGLMYSKQIEYYNSPVSPEIESVAQFYVKMLKGYVGISTVLSYTLILYQIYLIGGELFVIILLVLIDPILIIMLFTPISFLFELFASKLSARLLTSLKKQKIDIKQKSIKIE